MEYANPNLYHVFKRQVPATTAVKGLPFRFHIIPGNTLLAAIEEALEEGDETLLRSLITGIKDQYDYILLDSPPGKAMLAISALSAADELIIPLPAERPALDGVQDLLRFISEIVWEKHNNALKIRGILPTMYKKPPPTRQAWSRRRVKSGVTRCFRCRFQKPSRFPGPTMRASRSCMSSRIMKAPRHIWRWRGSSTHTMKEIKENRFQKKTPESIAFQGAKLPETPPPPSLQEPEHHERTNGRTDDNNTSPPTEGVPSYVVRIPTERRKTRHPFDIFEDQLDGSPGE